MQHPPVSTLILGTATCGLPGVLLQGVTAVLRRRGGPRQSAATVSPQTGTFLTN